MRALYYSMGVPLGAIMLAQDHFPIEGRLLAVPRGSACESLRGYVVSSAIMNNETET